MGQNFSRVEREQIEQNCREAGLIEDTNFETCEKVRILPRPVLDSDQVKPESNFTTRHASLQPSTTNDANTSVIEKEPDFTLDTEAFFKAAPPQNVQPSPGRKPPHKAGVRSPIYRDASTKPPLQRSDSI